jgi:hypothetical protein
MGVAWIYIVAVGWVVRSEPARSIFFAQARTPTPDVPYPFALSPTTNSTAMITGCPLLSPLNREKRAFLLAIRYLMQCSEDAVKISDNSIFRLPRSLSK